MTAPRALLAAGLATVLAGLAGCGAPTSGPGPVAADVVALFDGGTVTAMDLDRAVLGRLPVRRRMNPEERIEWYEQVIRDLVVARLLLDQARQSEALQNQDLGAKLAAIEREIVVDAYLGRYPLVVAPVTDKEVRRRYDRGPRQPEIGGRRRVRHIFRRRGPENPDQLGQELLAVRQRVMAGADFAELAAELSESETRFDGGDLGWLVKESLAPDLAALVFDLEPGVPSMPVTTADGVHLFLVEAAVAPRQRSYPEAAAAIRRQLTEQRRQAASERLVRALPEPANIFVADASSLRRWLESATSRTIVLRIGDVEVNIGRFRYLLDQEKRRSGPGAAIAADADVQLLHMLELRARIYFGCVRDGFDQDPLVREQVDRRREQEQVRHFRGQKVAAEAKADPERLQRFYDVNRMRFTNPLRLDLLRLRLPLASGDRVAVMKRLEQVCAAPDRFAEVAAEFGGDVQRLGLMDFAELRRSDPRAATFAVELATGDCSPAFRNGPFLELIQVAERVDPRPLPLASIRDRVHKRYLRTHYQELDRAWSDRLLKEAGLQVLPERLRSLVTSPESLL